jgi:hypothetical protein
MQLFILDNYKSFDTQNTLSDLDWPFEYLKKKKVLNIVIIVTL